MIYNDNIRRKDVVRLYDILLLKNKKIKIDKSTIIVDLSKNRIFCNVCGKSSNLTNPKSLEPRQISKYKEIIQEEINIFKEKHGGCKNKI